MIQITQRSASAFLKRFFIKYNTSQGEFLVYQTYIIHLFVPSVNTPALEGAENSSVKTAVAVVEIGKILLHIFSLRVLILRAGALFNGEENVFRKAFYHLFLS